MAHFDLFVIGGGSGGVACSRRAASYGAKVGLCEDDRLGGTCVIRGCIPKKLMHYAAHFSAMFDASRAYGWQIDGTPPHDWSRLIEARDREVARLNRIYRKLLDDAGVAFIAGRGRVSGKGKVTVATEDGEQTHTAELILIAVGGRPHLPEELPGAELAITSDDSLELMPERPDSIAVIGGGYIGIEQASIYHGLGVPTTLVLRQPLPLRGFDGDLRDVLCEQLRTRGMRVVTHTDSVAIEQTGKGLRLETSARPIEAHKILLATGRKPLPNTAGIGLEEIGVELAENGAVMVDGQFRSSVEGVRAVGDCSDHGGGDNPTDYDLTPLAIAEGRWIADTLFGGKSYALRYDTVPTAVFGLPQAATVGLAEEAARARGFEVEVYKTAFRPLLHTITGHEDRTFMKLVVDRAADRVLGCHMVGDEAGEIIQGFAVALTAGATKAQFDATVGLHPSAAEEFVTMYQPAKTM